MEIIKKETMYKAKSRCYGCNEMTSNFSGMCDKCGSDNGWIRRKPHTLPIADAVITGQRAITVVQKKEVSNEGL